MLHVSLHGLYQIRDELEEFLELYIYVTLSLLDTVLPVYQVVIE